MGIVELAALSRGACCAGLLLCWRLARGERGRADLFGMAVVCYLFLGGAGAGACFVLAILGLLTPRECFADERFAGARVGGMCASPANTCRGISVPQAHRTLFFPAYVCAAGVLVMGVVFLAVDLGRVDRLLLLVLSPSATYLVVGAYALVFCILLAIALAAAWGGFARRLRPNMLVVLEWAMLVCSSAVMVYTGLLLQSLRSVPLWNTVWLPVLFVLSSVSCGFAFVLALAYVSGSARDFASLFGHLVAADAVVVLAEILTMGLLIASAWHAAAAGQEQTGTSIAAAQSLDCLLRGSVAPVFWGLFAGLGLVVPLAMEMIVRRWHRFSANAAVALAACILVGGFVLRWCLVEVGMRPMLVMMG